MYKSWCTFWLFCQSYRFFLSRFWKLLLVLTFACRTMFLRQHFLLPTCEGAAFYHLCRPSDLAYLFFQSGCGLVCERWHRDIWHTSFVMIRRRQIGVWWWFFHWTTASVLKSVRHRPAMLLSTAILLTKPIIIVLVPKLNITFEVLNLLKLWVAVVGTYKNSAERRLVHIGRVIKLSLTWLDNSD